MKKLFVVSFLLPSIAFAQVHVAKIFSDNMILQREQSVHIWEKGIPGKRINISFAKENRTAIVQSDSSWNVSFGKHEASSHPQSITVISGRQKYNSKMY